MKNNTWKRVISLLLAITLIFGNIPVMTLASEESLFSGGSGTSDDPYVFKMLNGVPDGTLLETSFKNWLGTTSSGWISGTYYKYGIGELSNSNGSDLNINSVDLQDGVLYNVAIWKWSGLINTQFERGSDSKFFVPATIYNFEIHFSSDDKNISIGQIHVYDKNGEEVFGTISGNKLIYEVFANMLPLSIEFPVPTEGSEGQRIINVDNTVEGSFDNTDEVRFSEIGLTSSSVISVKYTLPAVDVSITNGNGGGSVYATKEIEGEVVDIQVGDSEQPNGTVMSLLATPASGYEFQSWWVTSDNGTMQYLSPSIDVTVMGITECVAYFRPVDSPGYVATYTVSSTQKFIEDELPYAIKQAPSGETIVLIDDATLSEDITVPSGVDFLLPYNTGDSNSWTIRGSGDMPFSNMAATASNANVAKPGDTNTSVTLNLNDAQIKIADGAKLVLGGQISSNSNGFAGHTYGTHADIVMEGNSGIVVEDGGILSSCGFITGNSVVVRNGGKLYQPFVFTDFSGGSYTYAVYNKGNSPLNHYLMMNVQSDIHVDYGAHVYGYAAIYAGDQFNYTLIPVVSLNSDAFMYMSNNATATIKYHPDVHVASGKRAVIGQNEYILSGGAKIQYLSIKVKVLFISTTVSTENIYFAIPSSIKVVLNDGAYEIGALFKVMPGGEIIVNDSAKLIIPSGSGLRVYDGLKMNGYSSEAYPSGEVLSKAGFSEAGKLIVNGTLEISGEFSGKIETTEDTGEIIVKYGADLVSETVEEGIYNSDYDYNYFKTNLVAQIWNPYVGEDGNWENLNAPTASGQTITYYSLGEGETTSPENYIYSDGHTDGIKGQYSEIPERTGHWIDPYLVLKDHNNTQLQEFKEDYKRSIPVAEPSREGYTFGGWYYGTYDADNNTVDYDGKYTFETDENGNLLMPKEIVTLYAKWDINQYTISFAEVDGSVIATITQDYNTEVTPPDDPTRVGYEFAGWDAEIPGIMPADNLTIKAKWNPIEYTITLKSGDEVIGSITRGYETDIEKPDDPTKTGYEFAGWYTDDALSQKLDSFPTTMPLGGATYYANWTAKVVDVKLDPGDGKLENLEDYTQKRTYDGEYGELPTPERTGYNFTGWYLPDGQKVEADTHVKNDGTHTLTAGWEAKNDIVVTFNAGENADATPDPIKVTFDTVYGDLPEPTRTGYKFGCWMLDNDLIESETTVQTAVNHELVAVWEPITYTVVFQTEDGAFPDGETSKSVIATYDATISLPTPPQREGYSFAGWFDGDTVITAESTNLTETQDEQIIATAQWTINQYTITFDTDGGNSIAAITQDYNSGVTAPADPTKTGYTFAGWDKEIPGTMPAEDVTIKATWTVNQYTITFDTDGGSTVEAITQDYDTEVMAPAAPTKTGYTFAGWDTEIPKTMLAEDITITAKWTINQYTISFDTDGGSAVGTITQDYGTEVTAPADPTKTGYTFAGWDAEIPKTMPAEDITITAKWTINQYTISFDTDGGSAVGTITQDYGTEVTAPADPTKTGYTFAGWDTEIPETMPAKDMTIKAQWTINQYTISFDTDGGSSVGAITQDYDTAVPAPAAPTKTGYTFDGWDTEIPGTMPAKDMTIKAKWRMNTYTITYDVNGAYNSNGTTSYTVVDDDFRLMPASKMGYTFMEWSGDGVSKQDDVWVFDTATARNVEFTAHFEPNTYTVTFVYGDGVTENTTAVVTYDGTYEGKLPEPSRAGYDFSGWYTSGVGGAQVTSDTMVSITRDTTYYARWTPYQYKVVFHSNTGDQSETKEQCLTYDRTETLLENTFLRSGYTFAGWNTNRTGDGTAYIDKDVVVNLSNEKNAEVHLYAQWNGLEYTVNFHCGVGGSGSMESQTFVFGTAANLKENGFTKTGFEFVGWDYDGQIYDDQAEFCIDSYVDAVDLTAKWDAKTFIIRYGIDGVTETTSATYGQKYAGLYDADAHADEGYDFDCWMAGDTVVKNGDTVFILEDTTLTPVWKPERYELTLDYGVIGGTGTITAIYGKTYGDCGLAAPSSAAYVFEGWYFDAECTEKVTFETLVTTQQSRKLYAKWSEANYSISYEGIWDQNENPEGYVVVNLPLALKAPVREGYTFTGWTGSNGTEAQKEVLIPAGTTGNLAYTANWVKNQYTVQFEPNGGLGEMPEMAFVYDEAQSLTDNTFVRIGYTFQGWSTDPNASVADYINGQSVSNLTSENGGTITLYAVWSANKYFVRFNANGGSGQYMSDQLFEYGAANALRNNTFTRAGYEFMGWATTDNGAVVYRNGETINSLTSNPGESIDLYAVWQKIPYTVTLIPAGGSVSDTDWIGNVREYDVESNDFTLPDITREGFVFIGWTGPNLTEVQNTVTISSGSIGNRTYTANWQANSYSVAYVNEDERITETGFVYGMEKALKDGDIFQKTGYVLSGWDSDGDNVADYGLGAVVTNLTAEPDKTVVLNAVWTPTRYKVIFNGNSNDGGDLPESICASYDEMIQIPETNLTRDGFTFKGWSRTYSNELTGQISEILTGSAMNLTAVDGGEVTLYAVWERNTYTINFQSNDGSAVDSVSAKYQVNVGKPTDPTRIGYSFDGWYADEELSIKVAFPVKMPLNGATYYAKWKINQYTITFNTDGGNEIEAITQDYGTALTAPSDPIKTGYTFAGWDKEVPAVIPAENMSITAKWTINQYTITFNCNGGTEVGMITQDYNTAVVAPVNPTKLGYTFAGWDKAVPSTMPAENVTINAIWSAIPYSIVFQSNGGDEISPIEAGYETEITQPSNPSRTGYTFMNWYTDAALTEELMNFPKTMPLNGAVFYAKWNANSYRVTFDTNGGKETFDAVEIAFDSNYGELPMPTRTGYTFDGWYAGENRITAGTKMETDQPHELTAKWTANQYKVVFHPNTEELSGTKEQTFVYDVAAALNANAYSRTDFSFIGWNTQEDGMGAAYADEERIENLTAEAYGEIHLYAQWTPKNYTISFVITEDTTQNFGIAAPFGSALDEDDLVVPKREGYAHTGWYMDSKCIKLVDFTTYTVPSGGANLYAGWSICSYDIVFNSDGGTEVATITKNFNAVVNAPTAPTKDGYTFIGWVDQNGTTQFTEGAIYMPAGGLNLTAQWEINQYTISFIAMGGSDVGVITQDYGTRVTAPQPDPTRAGYEFAGWYKDRDYAEEYTFTTIPAEHLVLYAKWDPIEYTITFEANGGSEVAAITQDYTTAVTRPADPEKIGHTFAGWYKEPECVNLYSFSTMPLGGLTLYAKWTVNRYSVTLGLGDAEVIKANGWSVSRDELGNVLVSYTGEYGTNIPTALPVFSRAGYRYENSFAPVLPETIPAQSTVYHAVYTSYLELLNAIRDSFEDDDLNLARDYYGLLNDTQTAEYTGTEHQEKLFEAIHTRVHKAVLSSVLDSVGPTNEILSNVKDEEEQIHHLASMTVNNDTFTMGVMMIEPDYPALGLLNVEFMTEIFSYETAYEKISQVQIAEEEWINLTGQAGVGGDQFNIMLDIAWIALGKDKPDLNKDAKEGALFTKESFTTYLSGARNDIFIGSMDGATMPVRAKVITAEGIEIEQTYTISFYNQYHTVTYELGYDGADEDQQNDVTIKNTAYEMPVDLTVPERDGYRFEGWFLDDVKVDGGLTMGKTNITLVAKWSRLDYPIVLDLTNGSLEESVAQIWTDYTYHVESAEIKLPTPERTGYTFTGWTGSNGETAQLEVVVPTGTTGALSYTANWNINQYTITFDTAGGSSVKSITADFGSGVKVPDAPAKLGYTFNGWLPALPETMPARDTTVVAQWSMNQYTIRYENVEGWSNPNPTAYNVGSSFTLVNPTREGYTFAGWKLNEGMETSKEMTVQAGTTGDLVFSAVWSVNSYNLIVNDGLGNTTMIPYEFGQVVEAPAVSGRTGYTFEGWSPEVPATMPARDVTVTAQWKAMQFVVTLNPGEGTVDPTQITVTFDQTYSNLPTPVRENYGFLGWYTENDTLVEPGSAVTLTQNIILTAKWKAGAYSISYDLDGGSVTGNPTSYTVEDGDITLVNPDKKGHTFLGWSGTGIEGLAMTVVIPSGSSGERNYKANWEINQYTVTIDYADGTEPQSITQDYDTQIQIPADPAREGYTFLGWDQEIPTVMPAENVKVTAQWSVNQYTITFKDYDDKVLGSVSTDYGKNFTPVTAPQRIGYTFTGWSEVIPETMPARNMEVKAQYTINQYSITLDYADGVTSKKTITQDYGSQIELPADPTRVGYTFLNWDKDIPATMPAENVVITAQWKINQRTITYLGYDGSKLGDATQDYGTPITAIAAPSRTGYTFAGWSPAVPATMPDENVTVQAQYQVNSYKVYFYDTDGTKLVELDVNYGEAIPAVDDPEKAGYKFNGWQNLPEVMPANELYVYAVWTTEQFDLVFMVDGEEYTRVKTSFGTEPGIIADPVKEGYTFSGWSELPETMPAHEVVITGFFEPNRYSIAFDPNNGQGSMEELHMSYDVQAALSGCNFIRTGYSFSGWNTEFDGSGASYADGEQVKNLTAVNGGRITLYAMWKAKTYEVELDYNGGEAGDSFVTVTYDNTYVVLPMPVRDGYDFAGWSDGANYYNASTPVAEPVPEKLTAQWTAQGDTPYTVYHYQQALDGTYNVSATQSMTGATDTQAVAKTLEYTGFVLNSDKSTASGIISADGKLELHLYYDRIEYTVTWKAAGTQIQEKCRYGQLPVYTGETSYEDLYAIYTFDGWDSEIAEVTGNVTYTAEYTQSFEASFFDAATGDINLTYARLTNALAAAKNGQTVRLEMDVTLSENLTVPAGVTLLLPCMDRDYGYNLVDKGKLKFNHDYPNASGGQAVLYCTLTVPEGIILSVDGTVLINSVSGRKSGGTAEMDITGGYGQILLEGDIIVRSGGALDCFGYIKGSGTVTAKNGASVGDLYIVRNWRGGSQAFAMYQSIYYYGDPEDPDKRQVYPMNEYDCHNIETDVVVEYGASYDGMVKMCANAGSGNAYYYTRFPQVHVSNGLIRLTGDDAYVVRSYDPEAGEENYTIYGGANFSESSLNIAGVPLSTKDFLFPIDGDISFDLYSGKYHFVNDYKFLTGGGLTVHSGAELTVDEGVYVALYDEFLDKPNTGDTQYPIRDPMVLTVKEGGKFTNAGTFGGSIYTESPDILIGYGPVWGITTLEANGYTNGTVQIQHELNITRTGFTWRYGQGELGEVPNSIIWNGADYADLLAALKTVPENLDIYSDETADPLEEVLNTIVFGLGIDKQDQVDEWTAKLLQYVPALKLRTVTVVFDANGGITPEVSRDITYGNAYGALPVPSFYGFEFRGWFDSDNRAVSDATVMDKVVNTVTLTAKWEKIPADYTVVNAAIASIPADMTGYTEESVRKVMDAEKAVDMTLGLAQQDEVNAMAQAILDAIDALERVQIIVSFDSNGGEPVADFFQVRYGDDYPYDALPVPVREGYTFLAWYTAKEGGVEIKENTVVTSTENVILYAKWSDNSSTEPADYTVVEIAKSGIPADLAPYTAASVNKLDQALNAVVPGLTADRQSDINAWAEAIRAAVEGLTYKTVTVYLDPVNGVCVVKSIQVTYGDEVVSLPEASWQYHQFLGWYTDKEGGQKVEPEQLTRLTDNLTVYAQYVLLPADYSRLEALCAQVPADLSVYSDESAEALEKALAQIEENYTADLQTIVDGWARELETAIKGLTYRTVTMTFDAQGGKVTPENVTVQYGSTIGWLPTPEYSYHVFDGWFTQALDGEPVTPEMVSKYTQDFAIYAHWTQIDADYSRVDAAIAKVPGDLNVYTEESAIALSKAVEQVEFGLHAGYQKQIDKWANEINKAIQNLRGKSVTVTFAYNGGTRGLISRVVRYGETYGNLPATTKEGYEFAGWYTANVGGEKVESSTVMYLLENHKLYARWIGGPADYSAVDAAIQRIPENLSIYTDASVQALNNAVAAVERNLLVEEQSRVDAWAVAINKAVDGLAHEHSYSSAVTKEAGCTEPGVKTFTCVCGDSYTEGIPATGHSWDDGKVTTPPDCLENGVKTFTCVCGDSYTEEIPATGHSEMDLAPKAATCTENGLTAGKKCSVCAEVLVPQESIDPIGHNWDDGAIVDQPSCSKDGIREHTCGNCGDTYTAVVEATGAHVYVETVVKAATCVEAGTVKRTCGCGESYEMAIAPMGHSYVNGVCVHCGELDPDHRHSYNASVTKEPGCIEAGLKTFACVCGDSYTEEIVAAGHTWDSGKVTTEPGCETIGVKTYTCADCSSTYTEEIAPIGHSYDNGLCIRCREEDPEYQVTEPTQETTAPTEPVFKGADYTGVDAAIQRIPQDLSQYTDETVQKLNNAVSEVRRGLDERMQLQVDEWAQAIDEAVDALWFRPANVTTTKPETKVEEDKAITEISDDHGEQLIKEAVQRESSEIVIAPEVEENVTKAEVSISAATVEKITEKTDVSLTVSTPVANVFIPKESMDELSGEGSVVVKAEKVENQVTLEVNKGTESVENVTAGMTITIPHEDCRPGTVAVMVHEDGTREVIRKSVADEGKMHVTVPVNGSATLEIVDNSKKFDDVADTDWYANAVVFAGGHQLFQGTSQTAFSPNANTTRAMLAVVIYRMENDPEHAFDGLFHDVVDGSWYEEGVYWAADAGIVKGYSDGNYGPDDDITREQLVTMLWRYAGSPESNHDIRHFTDATEVSDYAQEAVCWANEKGILNGMGDGTLNPGGKATRAQVAQLFMNFMMNLQ